MSKHLDGVKVGDKIKSPRKFSMGEQLFTVASCTPTLAKCSDGTVFRIDSGLMMGTGGGSGWDRRHGYLASEADIARIELAIRIRTASEQTRSITVTAANLAAAEAFIAASQAEIGKAMP
jgi:hypothetical protein